jgi:hypothetical protein
LMGRRAGDHDVSFLPMSWDFVVRLRSLLALFQWQESLDKNMLVIVGLS